MGFPDYYASKLLPEDDILDSVAYQDELKKMQDPEDKQKQDQEDKQVKDQKDKQAPRKEDEQVIDETGAESKDDEYHIPLRFWILLVLVIVCVYRLFLANN